MKRPLLITIGIILVVLLVAAWVYIMFFNEPSANNPDYANLNLGNTTDATYTPPEPPATEPEPVVDVTDPKPLRQLTTRPVIGYQEVLKDASSTPVVYYVESGTGHVYTINLASGEEKRISGTTIPASRKAVITPNGQYVMIQSGSGRGAGFIIGTFSTTSDSLTTGLIAEPVVSFTASTDNTFLYAVQTNDSTIAKEYDPTTGETHPLFTIPFREATIVWGRTADDTHYVYPKAATKLESGVFMVSNGTLHRLPITGYGLSAVGSASGVLYSEQIDGTYQSFIYDTETDESLPLGIAVIPEKCTTLHEATAGLICGGSFTTTDRDLPDAWYQGIKSFADDLWSINNEAVGTFLIDINQSTGRDLDVDKLSANQDDTHIYFVNSHTNNLWLFDRSIK